MAEQQIDTFVCVHQRDVGYLLELVLRSYELNFCPKGRLILITNDLPHLRAFVDRTGVGQNALLTTDGEWLSQDELKLPGWYRQQVIKLRAHRFCETDHFCNLGADTMLLQPIEYKDLVDDGDFPVLYYSRHLLPDTHYRYERNRVQYVADILRTQPTNALRYTDFINDLFCFNRSALVGLNEHLATLYGDPPYSSLLQGLSNDIESRNRFGEWTLYSVYLLDVLKRRLTVRNTGDGYLYQAHSKLRLRAYRFNTKVVHFVGKDFDVDYIKRQVVRHQPAFRSHL